MRIYCIYGAATPPPTAATPPPTAAANCHDVTNSESGVNKKCYEHAVWAMETGVRDHADDWYKNWADERSCSPWIFTVNRMVPAVDPKHQKVSITRKFIIENLEAGAAAFLLFRIATQIYRSTAKV